jgi:hypothetical protein
MYRNPKIIRSEGEASSSHSRTGSGSVATNRDPAWNSMTDYYSTQQDHAFPASENADEQMQNVRSWQGSSVTPSNSSNLEAFYGHDSNQALPGNQSSQPSDTTIGYVLPPPVNGTIDPFDTLPSLGKSLVHALIYHCKL